MSTLRTLLKARVAGDKRPEKRQDFCLDPDAQTAWIDATNALAAFPPPADGQKVRANSQRHQALARLAETEAAVKASVVTGVFRVLKADTLAELRAGWSEQPASSTEQARQVVAAAFVRFEQDGVPIPVDELGRDDLAELLTVADQAEFMPLATWLTLGSAGGVDLPKSGQPSPTTQTSATS